MSSLGSTIAGLRRQRHLTQQALSRISGVGVAYLSRLERGRLMPSMRTLNRLAEAFQVPVSAFFAEISPVEGSERCPVSASGRCVLDAGFAARGRIGQHGERYSAEHLRAMKLCDFLMHEGDAATRQAVVLMLNALVGQSGKDVRV